MALISTLSFAPFVSAGIIDFEDITVTGNGFNNGVTISQQYESSTGVTFSQHTPTTNEYVGIILDDAISPPKFDAFGNLVRLRDIVEDNIQDSLWRVINDWTAPSGTTNQALAFSRSFGTQSIEINFDFTITEFSADFQGITADTNAGLGDVVNWYVMAFHDDSFIDVIIKESNDINEVFSLEKSFSGSVNRITITSTAYSGMMDNLHFTEGSVVNQVPVSSTLSLLLTGLLFRSLKRSS